MSSAKKCLGEAGAARPRPKKCLGEAGAARPRPKKCLGGAGAVGPRPKKCLGGAGAARPRPRKCLGGAGAVGPRLKKCLGGTGRRGERVKQGQKRTSEDHRPPPVEKNPASRYSYAGRTTPGFDSVTNPASSPRKRSRSLPSMRKEYSVPSHKIQPRTGRSVMPTIA